MKSPLDTFFKLGDKVTGGDPKKMMDWNYYMLWVIFIAFFGVFLGNFWEFIQFQKVANLGWAIFGLAIMWFQYGNLKQTYGMRKLLKKQKNEPQKTLKVESFEEMMEEFK